MKEKLYKIPENSPTIVSEPAVAYKKTVSEMPANVPFHATQEERREHRIEGQIHGLPYTHKERMADIRKAEENYAMGQTITSEELKKMVTTYLFTQTTFYTTPKSLPIQTDSCYNPSPL